MGRGVPPGGRRSGRGRLAERHRPGKTPGPGAGLNQPGSDADDEAARRTAVEQAERRTDSRRDLARKHRGFEQVSPEPGALDAAAFGELSDEDPDEALSLLADLTGATDPALRALARRLAGRVLIDLAAPAGTTRRGPLGKLRTARLPDVGGDLDLDASLGPLLEARAARRPPSFDDLRGQVWSHPSLALCLIVDRSGSMGGERLAAAALAAACVAWRAPEDHSVLAFAEDPLVVQRQGGQRSAEAVAGDLFALRGQGPTDLAAALRAAARQLERSNAQRRLAIVFSDCRPTAGGDPAVAAREVLGLGELAIVAPADDEGDAAALASAVGGRCVTLAGPASVPDTMATLFAR